MLGNVYKEGIVGIFTRFSSFIKTFFNTAIVQTFVSIGAIINAGEGTMTAVAGVVDPLLTLQDEPAYNLFNYKKRTGNSSDFVSSRHSELNTVTAYRTCGYVLDNRFTSLTCKKPDEVMRQMFGDNKEATQQQMKGCRVTQFQTYTPDFRLVHL